MIEITENKIKQIEAILSAVPGGAEKAYTKAINTAIKGVKKTVYREVMGQFAISKDVLEKYTEETVRKASSDNVCGTVIFSGEQIPLYKYSLTSPKKPSRHLKMPVIGGQQTAAVLEGAFVQRMKSGHLGIFRRTGGISQRTGKPEITELMGSSLRSMANNSVVLDKVYEEMQKKVDTTLEKEIERLLRG